MLKRIEERKMQEEKLKWEGSFADYLEIVKEKPHICQLAHERIYNMIVSAGVEHTREGKRYKFFENELFGIDKALERFVEDYLQPAAHRLDVRKRILLLMGPVSGGKSTLVTLLKRGLERYTRTEEGAVYAIKGCPMHEEPLHLIPREFRDEFQREYGVYIEGELCPVCRLALEKDYGGGIKKVPVERIFFSEEERVGIGTFTPSDPKSQDIADLTGSVDFSTIMEYGSESDPRAYRFDGELNIANRGIMEFQEMLKCDERFLWNLLSLSQEGNFKAGRFALIYADEMIIAHTNEAEFKAFISNEKNEALRSRIIVVRIPYNLEVKEEIKIYEKLIAQSNLRLKKNFARNCFRGREQRSGKISLKDVHIAPHALSLAAMFSVMSRLRESKKKGLDIVKKMKLYNGEKVNGFNNNDLEELRAEAPGEGMFGVDPRYVINRLSSVLASDEKQCIGPIDVLRALKSGLDQHPTIKREERDKLLHYISLVREEYNRIAHKEVHKAFVDSYEDSAQVLFETYLDNVEAYCSGVSMEDPVTGERFGPDEKLMRAIEEQICVSENSRRCFREEILIQLSSYARRGERFDYKSHERLREAVEKKLFSDLKNVVKIITFTGKPERSNDKRLREIIGRLINKYSYCEICAVELLRYVGSLLAR